MVQSKDCVFQLCRTGMARMFIPRHQTKHGAKSVPQSCTSNWWYSIKTRCADAPLCPSTPNYLPVQMQFSSPTTGNYVLQPCLKTGNRIWIAEMVCRPFFVFMATSKYKSARGWRKGSIRRREECVEVCGRALSWQPLAKTSSCLWKEPQKEQIHGCPSCPAQEESASVETRQANWGKSNVANLVWQVGNDPL